MVGKRGGRGWSGRRQAGQGLKHRGRGGGRVGGGNWGNGQRGKNGLENQRSYRKATAEFMEAKKEADDRMDQVFGFDLLDSGEPRLGWLLNMLPTTVKVPGSKEQKSSDLAALELFFLQQDGSTFKAHVLYRPYFYLITKDRHTKDVKSMLERRYPDVLDEVMIMEREDLDLANHLSGKKRTCLKLLFKDVSNMLTVRQDVLPVVKNNQASARRVEAYNQEEEGTPDDPMDALIDIREYDVPYYTRVSIDLELNVGSWYTVKPRIWDGSEQTGLGCDIEKQAIMEKAEPRILAFDIECTKQPLKFPEADLDQVFMISYMFDGQGYLIINREVVSEDIEDFEYTPKPEFPGPFQVFNEADERSLLERFFEHCRELKPNVWVTYNGDFFDWPFIEARAKKYDMDMRTEVGVGANREGEYRGRNSVHMDCLYWVKRDSYLPAGSRGLKAVTKSKLGYDPVEVDPEDMCRFAQEQPHHMAAYSVSDAVATYYLYVQYINLFVFSLCTIIPMGPDDVLRKGSGTLCEMLLMVEAFRGNILCPNKQQDPAEKLTSTGQLLEQDTYIGGHVECLETGVYRDDLLERFRLDPDAFQELISNIDRDLTFAIEVESGIPRREVKNYDEVKDAIVEALELLRDTPKRMETPTIYHLDVAAMYPNIILSNRLQPSAMVDEAACASCAFNTGADASCKRRMDWMWRGEFYPATRSEFNSLKNQIQSEMVDGRRFKDLTSSERNTAIRKRVKTYCQTVYKRVKDTKVVEKEATICQRENPFYVNTVRAFRDRRYEYKGLTKKWSKTRSSLESDLGADPIALDDARNKVLLYDSLQVAHKCILNSFYGYVMRKGARWHSMEMAGVVTHTGGNIIKQARKLVERVGRPLELDTDGIWCILPASFPENFSFVTYGGRKIPISYPCAMLNADVHARFTNHQYQDLNSSGGYETHSECSIYFEVDGPYRCMVLPASQEEGKLLKKRYAVFNHDGSLAELKGFELKRRGELKIVQIFQSQVFEKFLQGKTLDECYAAVAEIADFWLDVLFSRGRDLTDSEVIELISENRSMSRSLDDYGDQKSTAISTAKRLGEFLGADLVKNKGLACKLLIAKKPYGAPTTERAIPTSIFSAEPEIRKEFLSRWLKDYSMTDFDVRTIIDWDYYIDRLGKAIQKIITIPAALQNVKNPVPRVQHPDWLLSRVREKLDSFKQRKISSMFTKAPALTDMEDMCNVSTKPAASIRERPSPMAPPGTSESTLAQVAPLEQQQPANMDSDLAGQEDESTFEGWLSNRKRKWRAIRERREQRQREVLGISAPGVSGALSFTTKKSGTRRRGLQSFVRTRDKMTMSGYWQIVEVRPEHTPGRFKLFVMSSTSELQVVFVKMPRTFYVNALHPDDSPLPDYIKRTRVNKPLPHGHEVHYLYRIDIDEIHFQRNAKEITNFVTRSDVAGVYEMNVPLVTRLVNQLGCVAKVHQHAVEERLQEHRGGGTTKDPFSASELKRLVHTTHPYLSSTSAEYRRIFCFQAGSQGRQVLVMFTIEDLSSEMERRCLQVEEESELPLDGVHPQFRELFDTMRTAPSRASCRVWISLQSGGERVRPNAERLLGDILEPLGEAAQTQLKPTFSEATVAHVSSVAQCWQGFDSALQEYATGRHGATTVVLQASTRKEEVVEHVTALGDFACVWVTAHREDDQVPPLQWQGFLVRRAIERYLAHSMWLYNRIKCSRYAHLPVAHVGDDFALSMADTFYMRLLEHNSMVLWASPSSSPDLGGFEADSGHHDGLDSTESLAHISLPGAYRSICVEVNILHLAVNTVLQASKIHDIECSGGSLALEQLSSEGLAPNGGTQRIGPDGTVVKSRVLATSGLMGSSTECLSAFRVLKLMVGNWFSDIHSPDTEFADALLVHFYRWLCSPQSMMYDPALHKFVHQLMLKVFMQLLAELRRLGATIVFANTQQVCICTGKDDIGSATAYVEHVLSTIRSRPLFANMHFDIRKYWQGLLFMDEENFGGVTILPLSSPSVTPDEVTQELTSKSLGMAVEENRDKNALDHEAMEVELSLNSGSENRAEEEEKNSQHALAADKSRSTSQKPDPTPIGKRRKAADGTSIDGDETAASDEENPFKNHEEEKDGNDEPSPNHLPHPERSDRGDSSDEDDEDAYDDDARQLIDDNMDDFIVDDENDDFYESQDPAEEVAEEDPEFEVEVNWNIVHFLPADLQEYFLWIIGEFVIGPVKFRKQWYEQRESPLALPDESNPDDPVQATSDIGLCSTDAEEKDDTEENRAQKEAILCVRVEDGELLEAEEEFLKRLVGSDLAQKLLRLVPKIIATQGGHESFPQLAGTHLNFKSPALEFVKSVCAVLALDSHVKQEVVVLKRSLLKLMFVSEFSPEAAFVNPSLTLVVRDLVCTFCNFCTDVDLCRSMHLMDEDAVDETGRPCWRCQECRFPYNMREIEHSLVQRVYKATTAFQLQDLECSKCGQVRADVLAEACTCSGPWSLQISVDDQRHFLHPFANVAAYYHMSMLADVVKMAQAMLP